MPKSKHHIDWLSNLTRTAHLLESGEPVNTQAITDELGCHIRQTCRYIRQLREWFDCPLEWCRDNNSYRLTEPWTFAQAMAERLRRPDEK